MRVRTTVVGPHRDDIEIVLEGRDAASFASEGQQRSVALAMKLGQARSLESAADAPPLFLIDDVFGELDPVRRNNLSGRTPVHRAKAGHRDHSAMDGIAPAAVASTRLKNGTITRET